ncbi:ATP-binding protein [Streptomyces regalis]|uniref:Regulator n=1 Tax=Streptomyces regalis TaxID=68262 RepID=A0A101JT14_9ACTN|nr:tetratricopeptide repeat protein [Streptomyces regalis]KUL32491.1 regulator [Streptomyces regalis]
MRGQERGGHNEMSGVVHGPGVQASVVHGGVHIRTGDPSAAPRTQRPWQLPRAVPLTDRTQEVERLEELRARATHRGQPALATVSGLGGVGKTALALAWLHRLRPDFPGGQLYADLGAQSPTGPADPAEVLSGFLRGFGVPPQQVPYGIAERAALYRSLTAERPVVVLLDDAVTAAQVRPLLPGGANVTLVTSRRRMSGLALEGGHQMHLEPLAPEAAVELLAVTLADDRVATEPDDARALVGLCAGLPLAVRVAGARLAARPQRRITTMVRALAAERGRLDALAIDGDHGVRAALDLSYRGLPPAAARLYRLLGVHPATEFGTTAARALLAGTGTGQRQGAAGEQREPWEDAAVDELLDVLHDANLLIEVGEDRYRFHDLVRLHAAAMAEEGEPPEQRAAAFRRLADHCLATATRAETAIDPQHPLRERSFGPGPVVIEDFGEGVQAALDWLDRELPTLLAVIRRASAAGAPEAGWQLADALGPFFIRRKHYDQWCAAHAEGLAAARELSDTAAQCRMLTSGGLGELGRGDHTRALEMFEEAARLFAADGDGLGRARTLNYRGLAQQRLGRLDAAAELFARAAAELPGCGDHRAGALARLNAADVELARGRLEQTAAGAAEARTTLLAVNDTYNAARAAILLGRVGLRRGRPDEAEAWLTGALTSLRDVAAHYEVARALESLGEAAEQRGQRTLARDRYREALDLYVAVNRPAAADELRERLRGAGRDAAAD